MKFLESIFHQKKPPLEDGNRALVQAMHEVAIGDGPEARRKLYEALLGSMLLIPVPEIPSGLAPGNDSTTRSIQFQFSTLVDGKQRRVAPAFTDVEALRNWDPNTPSIGIKAQEFFRLVMSTDVQEVLINAFDPLRKMIRPGGRVTRAEFDLLAKGIAPTKVGPTAVQFQLKKNEAVAIGVPAIRPGAEIEELLRNGASSREEIERLYLFEMVKGESSHTVIGIQPSGPIARDKEEELARNLGDSIRLKIGRGQSLDFMVLRGALGDRIRAAGIVIFKR